MSSDYAGEWLTVDSVVEMLTLYVDNIRMDIFNLDVEVYHKLIDEMWTFINNEIKSIHYLDSRVFCLLSELHLLLCHPCYDEDENIYNYYGLLHREKPMVETVISILYSGLEQDTFYLMNDLTYIVGGGVSTINDYQYSHVYDQPAMTEFASVGITTVALGLVSRLTDLLNTRDFENNRYRTLVEDLIETMNTYI